MDSVNAVLRDMQLELGCKLPTNIAEHGSASSGAGYGDGKGWMSSGLRTWDGTGIGYGTDYGTYIGAGWGDGVLF